MSWNCSGMLLHKAEMEHFKTLKWVLKKETLESRYLVVCSNLRKKKNVSSSHKLKSYIFYKILEWVAISFVSFEFLLDQEFTEPVHLDWNVWGIKREKKYTRFYSHGSANLSNKSYFNNQWNTSKMWYFPLSSITFLYDV